MTAAEIAALDALHAKAFAGCQRGCEGRHFSCTCGADEAVEGVLDAWPAVSAELRALRARMAELEALALQLECEASCYAADLAALKGATDD